MNNISLLNCLLIALLGFTSALCAQSGVPSPQAAQPPAAAVSSATVTKAVNVDGVSFKAGDTIAVEGIDKVTSAAITTRNGKKFRVPLRNLEMEEPPPAPTGNIVVKRAEYGVPGGSATNVTGKVQELVNQTASGAVPEILASGDLLAKQKVRGGHSSEKSQPSRQTDNSGRSSGFGTVAKNTLVISYTVNGEERIAQGMEGEKILLK